MAGNKLLDKLKIKATELKYDLSALYLAYKRKDTPILAKILIIIAIGYAIWPLDFSPDFIPLLGQVDDITVIALTATFIYNVWKNK